MSVEKKCSRFIVIRVDCFERDVFSKEIDGDRSLLRPKSWPLASNGPGHSESAHIASIDDQVPEISLAGSVSPNANR
jgi:hypothetical protein